MFLKNDTIFMIIDVNERSLNESWQPSSFITDEVGVNFRLDLN